MLTKVQDSLSQTASLLGGSSQNDKTGDTRSSSSFSDLFASVNAGALQQGQMLQTRDEVTSQFSFQAEQQRFSEDIKQKDTKDNRNDRFVQGDEKESNDKTVKDKDDNRQKQNAQRVSSATAAEQAKALSSVQVSEEASAGGKINQAAQGVTDIKQAESSTIDKATPQTGLKTVSLKGEQAGGKELSQNVAAESNVTAQQAGSERSAAVQGKQAEQAGAQSQQKQIPLNEMQQNNAILQQVKQDAQKMAQGDMAQNQQQNPSQQQRQGGEGQVPNSSLAAFSSPNNTAAMPSAQAGPVNGRESSFREVLNGTARTTASATDPLGNSSNTNVNSTQIKVRIEPSQIGKTTHLDKLAQEVVSTIRNFRFKPGSNELSVRIDPPHLGKLQIRVSIDKGKVDANVVAENEAVKRVLESNLQQLRGALEAQGLKVENFSVNVESNAQKDFASQGSNGDGKGNSAGRNHHENSGSAGEAQSADGGITLESVGHYRASSSGVQVLSTTI